MEIIQVSSSISAFIRPSDGANVGLIGTNEGKLLIDTTSSPADIQGLLRAAEIQVEEIKLVINTHFHSDHTWGNQVLSCPIVAQKQCLERMQAALIDDWSEDELQAYIIELEKTDPPRAENVRKLVENLRITLPDQLFEERFMGVMGGQNYEIIHLGGHTPDTSVVWLPSEKVLFASDLIFNGRYPYIYDADIPAWIDALNLLLEFKAKAIIPGHGVMCGEGEIIALRDYLQNTWQRTSEHIRLGRAVDEVVTDPGYSIYSTNLYDRLHQANIRYMYEQLKSLAVS